MVGIKNIYFSLSKVKFGITIWISKEFNLNNKSKGMLDTFQEKLVSRKLLVFITATLLFVYIGLDPDIWGMIAMCYIGGQSAIDFAKEPIDRLKKKYKNSKINLDPIQKDIFDLNKKYNNKFDYIIEYTCYCAIPPEMRKKYIDVMYGLLKTKGELVGIFFPINKDLSEGGPPFGVNLEETIDNFSNKFKFIESIEHPLSIDPRKGNEQFVRFIK